MRLTSFSILLFFSFLLHSTSSTAQCCTYTLFMQDTYGDSWNGGYLEVFRNDTSLGNFYGLGWGSASTFTACEGDNIRFHYTPGMYENENIYALYSPGYQLVFANGPNPTLGEALNMTANCDTIDIPGNHPCTALPIDTVTCITADNTAYDGSGLHPFCAEFLGGDAWYVIPVPSSGNVSINTDVGSLGDTGLGAWVGSDCSSIRRIGCDDDAFTDAYSLLTFYELNPNEHLYIQVFGYAGATGSFQLCVKDLGVVTIDSSALPIISINTLGQDIPDDPKITALMEIRYNGPGNITHVTDSANVYDGHIGIEIRGASSAGYPQRPYSIETRTEEGEDNDVELLGMPEEADWVFTSNFNDRSLIRNTLSHYLFTAMGNYSPRQQLVEVILNDAYRGIYVFGEKIKRDRNRVNIANLNPDDIDGDDLTGGYILEQNLWNSANSFQSNYSPIDHPGLDVHFLYEFPQPDEITEVQKTYIASYIDSLETALYSDDFTDPDTGYRKYLDEQSFIDYFLLNELARNNDGFKKSVFFHKDRISRGGKLKAGPIWDFDWAWKNMWGCDIFSDISGAGWAHHINDCPTDNYSCGWYIRMFQDTSFLNNLQCTYADYRETIFDTAYIFNYIDSMGLLVANAQERHFSKWPILGISGPAPEVLAVATTYEAELDTLKSWITRRINWLDEHMPGLCTQTRIPDVAIPNLVTCSPNPANDKIVVTTSEDAYLSLIDLNGRNMQTDLMHADKRHEIDVSHLSPGMYILYVRNNLHSSQSKLIISR